MVVDFIKLFVIFNVHVFLKMLFILPRHSNLLCMFLCYKRQLFNVIIEVSNKKILWLIKLL